MSFVLYTQILKQSVLKPASPGITLRSLVQSLPISSLTQDCSCMYCRFIYKLLINGFFYYTLCGEGNEWRPNTRSKRMVHIVSMSSLHIYTLIVSRVFMAGAASQAGDADSSRAPGLTSGLQRSVNVHRGSLLLVPQWRCTRSFVFYT